MSDSPNKTRRSSTSSPPIPKKPASDNPSFWRQSGFIPTATLAVLNVALLVLAMYFAQEGIAQKTHPNIPYFVDFPQQFLLFIYTASLLFIINLSFLGLTLFRRLPKRYWPWVTTALAVVCLGLVVNDIGWHGVRVIIDPSAAQ